MRTENREKHPSLWGEKQRLTCSGQELATITDQTVYTELQTSDIAMGRWTAEDPSLRNVQRWVNSRAPALS